MKRIVLYFIHKPHIAWQSPVLPVLMSVSLKISIIKLHHNLTDRNDAYGCLRFFYAEKIYKTIFA